MDLFIFLLFKDPVRYFFIVVLMAFSICVHEFCHSYAALKEGDDTGERLGFMTLNPMHVMGPTSIIALFLFGIAWGQVPIIASNMRHKWGAAWVSFCGPLSNLVLALLFSVLVRITLPLPAIFQTFFYCGAYVNVFLAVFNLLPIPSLDGWGVGEYFIPPMRRLTAEQRGVILLVAIILLWGSTLSSFLNLLVFKVLSFYEIIMFFGLKDSTLC